MLLLLLEVFYCSETLSSDVVFPLTLYNLRTVVVWLCFAMAIHQPHYTLGQYLTDQFPLR